MSAIGRSAGLATGTGFVVGGGYRGLTADLDNTVQRAAEALMRAYSMPVVIRFNSDRRSGGAWLKTHEPDGLWRNAEIGVGAYMIDEATIERQKRLGFEDGRPVGVYITAHIGRDAIRNPSVANSSGYYHETHPSIEDAISFVRQNGDLDHLGGDAAE